LLNSPYEAGKRLQRESTNLLSTGARFLEYLEQLEQLAGEAENLVLTNYQLEYQKLDQISDIMIRMIQEYKEKL
jgi:hypothetical protein